MPSQSETGVRESGMLEVFLKCLRVKKSPARGCDIADDRSRMFEPH